MGDPDRSQGEAAPEFRADPGAHWPIIITLAVLALLCVAGVGWLIIKPGPVTPGRILTAMFLGALGLLFVAGARMFWLRLQRRILVRAGGLEFFDGRQTHDIAWDRVSEIHEVISSVKMLGVTVDSPQLRLAIATLDGVRCEIDKDYREADRLAVLVSGEVDRRVSARALSNLERRRPVEFGCLSVSANGILITAPSPLPWREAVRQRFESQVNSRVVVPGEYAWENVRDLRITRALRGSRLSDHAVYSQIEIHVQGSTSPVYVCAIQEFPNFAAFGEVLDALHHPLSAAM
jgi:hypothetical protein